MFLRWVGLPPPAVQTWSQLNGATGRPRYQKGREKAFTAAGVICLPSIITLLYAKTREGSMLYSRCAWPRTIIKQIRIYMGCYLFSEPGCPLALKPQVATRTKRDSSAVWTQIWSRARKPLFWMKWLLGATLSPLQQVLVVCLPGVGISFAV